MTSHILVDLRLDLDMALTLMVVHRSFQSQILVAQINFGGNRSWCGDTVQKQVCNCLKKSGGLFSTHVQKALQKPTARSLIFDSPSTFDIYTIART